MKDKYIKQIIKTCGKNVDYIIILKMNVINDVINNIKGKLDNLIDYGGLYLKGNFENVELNIFKTGKILVRNIENEERLKDFLNKLFYE
ncbi:MAG: hypothetical protein N3E39_00945 [Candidatus Methanomethylicia archaeon]|nr:hypothetical protein [Candidatus Methanomethylicia archaeon]MDW7988514.1 hypothetical protein [Nitrososphaerota archaeon]